MSNEVIVMKKMFKRIVSAALVFSLAAAMFSIDIFAEAFTSETNVLDMSDEIFLLENDDFIWSSTIPQNPSAYYSSGDGSWLYGSFLDANNKAVYDALSKWTTPSLATIDIKFPNPVKVSISAMPTAGGYADSDIEILDNVGINNCKAGRDSVLFDYPEIFWLDSYAMYYSFINVSFTRNPTTKMIDLTIGGISITPLLNPSFDSLQESTVYNKQLQDEISAFVLTSTDRYGKVSEMHNKIAEMAHYDMNARFSGSAMGLFYDGGVVCEGYSKAFKLLCDREGIPCVLVFGNFNDKDMTGHMWNYVLMDDNVWYGIDVTWDDTDNKVGAQYTTTYFLRGSNSFFKEHIEFQDFAGTIFNYPVIAKNDYSKSNVPVTTAAATTTSATTTTTRTTTSTTTATTRTTTSTTTTTPRTTTSTTTTTTRTTVSTTTTSTTKATTITTAAPMVVTTTPTTPSTLPGDFNKDGVVNIKDLILCQKAILGMDAEFICDFNGDGIVDTFDLLMVKRAIQNG